MGRLELKLFYWLSRFAILFTVPIFVSDVGLYKMYANAWLINGHLPYLDFPYEYPPLGYLLVFLPAALQKFLGLVSLEGYRILLGLFLLPFDYYVFHKLRVLEPVKAAAFYYVLLSSLLPNLLFDRIDLVVGCLIVLPFLGKAVDQKFSLAWAIGGAVKVVPLLLLPLRLLDWPKWEPRRFLHFLLWPALVVLIFFGGVAYVGKGTISFLSHHSSRGVQVESIAASSLLLAKVVGYEPDASIASNFGAQHVQGLDWLAFWAKVVFWLALGSTALAIFALGYLGRMDSLRATWLLLFTFITFGYVLSPQYLLWLLPLSFPVAALLGPREQRLFRIVFGLVVLMTGVHFSRYWSYVALYPPSVVLVFTRNLLLVVLWGMSWNWLVLRRPST